MATAQDDGLDQIRRDLIDLVLREAGGRVAADPKSPVAQLLTGIVHREMAAAVDELRHVGAVVNTEALAEAIARRIGASSMGEFRSMPVSSGSYRTREIIIGCVAAMLAVAIFVGGFALGGGLNRLQPAPAAIPAPALTDPALIAPSNTDGAVPAAAPPASGDGTTGMATQLRERP